MGRNVLLAPTRAHKPLLGTKLNVEMENVRSNTNQHYLNIPYTFPTTTIDTMPPVACRELIVLNMPPDNPANRSISNFWFLNVTKHCTQSANNGTSYFDQKSTPAGPPSVPTPLSAVESAVPTPPLNPPTPACLNEGRRNNVVLAFLWGTLFIGLLSIIGLVILKHLRKARTIRQTRQNWVEQQQDIVEMGLGSRGCVASPVVVVGGAVDGTRNVEERTVRFANGSQDYS